MRRAGGSVGALAVLAAALFSGCATSGALKAATAPDGRFGYVVDCSNKSMDVCHLIAEATCNTPAYEVWEQHDWERQEGGKLVPDRKLHFTCPAGAR